MLGHERSELFEPNLRTLQRMTRLTHEKAAGETLGFYEYNFDLAGQLTNEVSHVETVDYTHDATGQLTGADRGVLPDEEYEYDAGGNRVRYNGTLYRNGPANRLVSDSDHLYGYDAEGNMTAITNTVNGEVETLSYDHRNRLVAFVRQGTNALERTTVTFEYDPMGRRIRKEVDGPEGREAQTFTYDRDNLWADIAGDGTKVRRLYTEHVDQVLARHDQTNQEQWYLTDRQGSVRHLGGPSGSVTGSAGYEAFGSRVGADGSMHGERVAFTGREFDAETGLHFYRARYYRASVGFFESEDALRWDAGEFNLVRYAGNGPVLTFDPSGESPAYENAGHRGGFLMRIRGPLCKLYDAAKIPIIAVNAFLIFNGEKPLRAPVPADPIKNVACATASSAPPGPLPPKPPPFPPGPYDPGL